MQLKVITYNIHKGFRPGNLGFILPGIKEALAEEAPDILFIQEVLGENSRKLLHKSAANPLNQAAFIAKEIWPYFVYSPHANYTSGSHGNGILSKNPLHAVKHITLSKFSRSSRGILYATIKLAQEPLHLICAHFGMLKNKRNEQIDALITKLDSIDSSAKILLAGDFNDWRQEDTLRFEHKFSLKEVMKEQQGAYAKTYPAIKPILPNDRIYFRGLVLQQAECLQYKPWSSLSDHLPISAKFSLE